MPRPSQAQMTLLRAVLDEQDPKAGSLLVDHADPRTRGACFDARWIDAAKDGDSFIWTITDTGREAVEAGIVSNATDKVNVRVPDALREQVDEKNRRIGSTTTAVIIDALRRYVAEDDERSALRLEARTAPDIRARREAGKVER